MGGAIRCGVVISGLQLIAPPLMGSPRPFLPFAPPPIAFPSKTSDNPTPLPFIALLARTR